MARSRSITHIGCSTKGWDNQYFVNDQVQRVLQRDPELQRILKRKLREHGRKLPSVIRMDQPQHTIVWSRSTPYADGSYTVRAVVVSTECLPDGRLMTRVTSQRMTFDHDGNPIQD